MKFRLFLVFILLFSFSSNAIAATLYIDPGISTLNRSDSITMAVRLMPDKDAGECINVVDAVLTYSDNIQPVDVSIGKSIFNVWVEQPVINKENHTITFAGGIPNGYCGRVQGDPMLTNILAEVVFRSPGMLIGGDSQSSEAVIGFSDQTQAYLNDGQGTKAPLRTLGSTITLEKTAGSKINDEWREQVALDELPPEEFSITLTKDEVAFSGKYFIVFDTIDKQTGISHYEVMEEPVSELSNFTWGGTETPWVITKSPYVLKDQTLNSTVRVKAVDKAGNQYVATLVPEQSLRTVSAQQSYNYLIFAGVIVVLLIVIGAVWYVRRVKKKRNEFELEEFDDINNKLDEEL